MKFMKILIFIISVPMVVQAAEQEHKRKAAEDQEQSNSCLCLCSCFTRSQQRQREMRVEEYLEANPQKRPQHLATGSIEMRQIRVTALHAPVNTDSAKNEQVAARLSQGVAARIEAKKLQAMQPMGFLHHQIPADQIIQINRTGIVEKRVRRKRKDIIAQHRAEDTASMEPQYSPRSGQEAPKTPLVFTFQDTTPQRKDSGLAIRQHDSVAMLPLPSEDQEPQLGSFLPGVPFLLPGVPDETGSEA